MKTQAKRNTYLVELIERLREWKRDRSHQQQQTDSESDSDDENECNGSRNDMLADSGWVETIRDKSYGHNNNSKVGKDMPGAKSEFMSKSKEPVSSGAELAKEFRQMNIADHSANSAAAAAAAATPLSSGSDLITDKVTTQSANFKLQQNVSFSFFFFFYTQTYFIQLFYYYRVFVFTESFVKQ